MLIDKIVKSLYSDNETNKVKRTEFVEFMENAKDPFIVLICCILSLRTNDKTTIGASKRMLKLGKTPYEIAQVDVKELEHAIYPVGFYKRKAEQIKEIATILVEKYNGQVPKSIDELTKFKGVGRKTANLVLTKGFNTPAICVDVHVHRICNRLGYVNTKMPDDTEMVLREKLPKKYWMNFNTLLVTHGQNICKPINPKCEKCSIFDCCKFYQLNHQ